MIDKRACRNDRVFRPRLGTPEERHFEREKERRNDLVEDTVTHNLQMFYKELEEARFSPVEHEVHHENGVPMLEKDIFKTNVLVNARTGKIMAIGELGEPQLELARQDHIAVLDLFECITGDMRGAKSDHKSSISIMGLEDPETHQPFPIDMFVSGLAIEGIAYAVQAYNQAS